MRRSRASLGTCEGNAADPYAPRWFLSRWRRFRSSSSSLRRCSHPRGPRAKACRPSSEARADKARRNPERASVLSGGASGSEGRRPREGLHKKNLPRLLHDTPHGDAAHKRFATPRPIPAQRPKRILPAARIARTPSPVSAPLRVSHDVCFNAWHTGWSFRATSCPGSCVSGFD